MRSSSNCFDALSLADQDTDDFGDDSSAPLNPVKLM